jgi:putative nucleotidyltransferase with HDIG domain
LRWHLFSTRVARRLVGTFLLAALLPQLAVSIFSYGTVTRQLRDQSEERLGGMSKTAGMVLVEKLHTAQAVLEDLSDPGTAAGVLRLPTPFTGLTLVRNGEAVFERGEPGRSGAWSPLDTLTAGDPRPLLRVDPAGYRPDLFMAVPGRGPGEVLWGRLDGDEIWPSAFDLVSLPSTGAICFVPSAGEALACNEGLGSSLSSVLRGRTPPRGVESIVLGREEHLVAGWEIFLPASFNTIPWSVVMSESRRAAYAPLDTFSTTFPLAMLLGLATLGLVANVRIRRTLEPLSSLARATRLLARGERDTEVEVATDDEFGELAASFNTMAGSLSTQFFLLETGQAIDQVALAELDRDRIMETLTDSCAALHPHRRVALLQREGAEGCHVTTAEPGAPAGEIMSQADLLARRVREAADTGASVLVEGSDVVFPTLGRMGFGQVDAPVTLFPVLVGKELRGALALGSHQGVGLDAEGAENTRRLVARAALGLQSAWLFKQLEEMAWGTLRAMARAIDAKSPWTAGHSERVSALAVALGRELGLAAEQLDLLLRGGLLHDVGKIGISASVLDHPGKLSDEQLDQMRQHPVIGARILEPIEAFREALPLVRSHHERVDGKGYPDGLMGNEIPYLARVMAVADVFDAMSSDRPYRPPIPVERVHEMIRQDSGTAFEPQIVEALGRVLARGWDHRTGTPAELVPTP